MTAGVRKMAGCPGSDLIRKAYLTWRGNGALGSKVAWTEADQKAAELASEHSVEVLRAATVMRQAFVNEQRKAGEKS